MQTIIDLARHGATLDLNLHGRPATDPVPEEGKPSGNRQKKCCGKCRNCTCTPQPPAS